MHSTSVTAHDHGAPASTPPHGSFVLSTPTGTIVAAGSRGTFTTPLADGLAEEVQQALLTRSGKATEAIVVGAIPFDRKCGAWLVAPEEVVHLPRSVDPTPYVARARVPGTGSARIFTVDAEPPLEAYRVSVDHALRMIAAPASPALRKVVLARTLTVRSSAPFRVEEIFARLRSDPQVTAYAVPLPPASKANARMLVGASPELLLAKHGRSVTSIPLAGSARRSPFPAHDQAAARVLTRSEKDRREHAAVVEWVGDRLAPFCSQLRVPPPTVVATRSMWHLGTAVEGTLKDPSISSLTLTEALHPTPAICGLPCEAARSAIDALETFDRGFFSGAVGWCDAAGDGEWILAIRCAELNGNVARLYAGAGIVAGSRPEEEGAETAAKFAAMLHALGVREEERTSADEA